MADHGAVAQLTLAVVGSGGLIGSHLAAELGRSGHSVHPAAARWAQPDLAAGDLLEALAPLTSQQAPWGLMWCAGAGVVATSAADLADEESVFRGTLDGLAARDSRPHLLFVASSAGGVYAGSVAPPFHEGTPPVTVSDYGRSKLRMEAIAQEFAQGFPKPTRVLIARFSNVYGPGQRLDKPQGLISQLMGAAAQRRPLPVTVSLDTIRDYLYVDDAALVSARAIERAWQGDPGTVVTKIIASGSPATVAQVIGEARRVLHSPVQTIVASAQSAGQVAELSFRSTVWPDLDELSRTPFALGIAAAGRDISARMRAGTLPF